MNTGNLFCCFSVPLRNFLTQNNIRYELCALNEKTHNTMWVYIRTDELNNKLTEWANTKPT